jgi:hypothetical protein
LLVGCFALSSFFNDNTNDKASSSNKGEFVTENAQPQREHSHAEEGGVDEGTKVIFNRQASTGDFIAATIIGGILRSNARKQEQWIASRGADHSNISISDFNVVGRVGYQSYSDTIKPSYQPAVAVSINDFNGNQFCMEGAMQKHLYNIQDILETQTGQAHVTFFEVSNNGKQIAPCYIRTKPKPALLLTPRQQ